MYRTNKYVYPSLLCLFLTASCGIPQIRQDREWPDFKFFGNIYEEAPVEKGFVLEKNGDSVIGYLKMVTDYPRDGEFDHVPVLPYGKSRASDIINVPLSKIDHAQISYTWPSNRSRSLDYAPVGNAMWLILDRKGNTMICQGSSRILLAIAPIARCHW